MLLEKLDTIVTFVGLIYSAQEIAILLLKFAFHLKHVVHCFLVYKLLGILLSVLLCSMVSLGVLVVVKSVELGR